jgi:hypothetical protein
MSDIMITHVCPSCEYEFEITVSELIPAQTYGPPENCYPEEGGECSPSECPLCGEDIDQNEMIERAGEREDRYNEEYDD